MNAISQAPFARAELNRICTVSDLLWIRIGLVFTGDLVDPIHSWSAIQSTSGPL